MTALRALDRVLVLVLALAVVALAVLVPVEVVRGLAGLSPVLAWPDALDALRDTSWSGGLVRGVAGGLIAVGVLLLGLQLWPRRPRTLPLARLVDGVATSTTRRSLRAVLLAAALTVDGVTDGRVAVGRRRVRVRARALLRGTASRELSRSVDEAVSARLAAVGLAKAPRVRVRVRTEAGA